MGKSELSPALTELQPRTLDDLSAWKSQDSAIREEDCDTVSWFWLAEFSYHFGECHNLLLCWPRPTSQEHEETQILDISAALGGSCDQHTSV